MTESRESGGSRRRVWSAWHWRACLANSCRCVRNYDSRTVTVDGQITNNMYVAHVVDRSCDHCMSCDHVAELDTLHEYELVGATHFAINEAPEQKAYAPVTFRRRACYHLDQ